MICDQRRRGELVAGQPGSPAHLGKEIRRAHDRSGDQMGKKRHQERQPVPVALGRNLAAIHVDRVAQRLKRIEGDADREHHVQGNPVQLDPGGGGQARHAGPKKIGVLEPSQKPEVSDNRYRHQPAAGGCMLDPLQPPADPVVDRRGEQDEQGLPAIVAGIEIETGPEQEPKAPFPESSQQPRGGENQEEESEILEAVERQRGLVPVSGSENTLCQDNLTVK